MKDCWHQGYAKPNPNSGKATEKIGFRYVQDGEFTGLDGVKHYETKEYILEVDNI